MSLPGKTPPETNDHGRAYSPLSLDFPHLPPIVIETIRGFDWSARPDEAFGEFIAGPLNETSATLARMQAASKTIGLLISHFSLSGALESELPEPDEPFLVKRLFLAIEGTTNQHNRIYWSALMSLLLELQVGVTEVLTEHTWVLERLVLESRILNLENQPELTVERCEAHLKLSRGSYGLNSCDLVREGYIAHGTALTTTAMAFFAVFTEAFRMMRDYERAVSVADFVVYSDQATQKRDLSEANQLARDRMDAVMAPIWRNDDGTVLESSLKHQINDVVELVDSFDRSISGLVSEGRSSDTGSLRRRRDVVRTAFLGFESGTEIRWERIESLALWGPRNTIADLLIRWLRNVDDDAFESLFVKPVSSAMTDWRLQKPDMGWWTLPYPAARTILVALFVGVATQRYGHKRALVIAEEILLGGRDRYWELGECLKDAPNFVLQRLANQAMNAISLALMNEADRTHCIDRLETYLTIGPHEERNALSEGLAAHIRSQCGLDAEGKQWDCEAFEMHLRLGLLLIQSNRFFEGTRLLKATMGIEYPHFTTDFRAFEYVVRRDPKSVAVLLAAASQVSLVENDAEPLRSLLDQFLDSNHQAWDNSSQLVDGVRKFVQEKKLPTFIAHQLLCAVAWCVVITTDNPGAGVVFFKQFLEIENYDEGQFQALFERHDPLVWVPVIADLIGYLGSQREYREILTLVAGLLGEPVSDRIEWGSVVDFFRRIVGLEQFISALYGPIILEFTLSALKGVGRTDEALALAKVIAVDWIQTESRGLSTQAKCSLAVECIRTLGLADHNAARELIWDISWFLVWDHDAIELTSIDRWRLVSLTVEARHILSDVANTLTLDEEYTERTQELIFPNELVLSVRQIVERIRRGKPALTLSDGPSLKPGWSMPQKYRQQARRLKSPDRLTTALSQVGSNSNRTVTVNPPVSDQQKREEWFNSVRWQRQVADAIGPQRLCLKVGFSMQGQLVWTLMGTEKEHIRVKAFGHGVADAKERIRVAVQRFQREIDARWDVREFPTESCCARAIDDLRWELNLDRGMIISPREFQEDEVNRMTGLGKFRRTCDQFFQEFGKPSAWRESGSNAFPEVAAWQTWWTETITLLSQCNFAAIHFSRGLDDSTFDLLNAVTEAWPLQELFDSLPTGCELLIQPSDVLHSVPIPFLFVRDRDGKCQFLFERVDCASVVVSPLIDWWQRETLDAPPQRQPDSTHRIASISWLRREELNVEADLYTTFLLQASHARLEKWIGSDYRWWSAGGSPKRPGGHAVLARGIKDSGESGLALLTICGHGTSNMAGVQMQDGLWQGREFLEGPPPSGEPWKRSGGVDLASVQFVILLSCSMGRLKQSRLRDVEGFCVDLIVNNARSVLAGRWTLHAVDSIKFAHRVAREYLRRHQHDAEAGTPLWKACTRGRAVAAARRRWAEEFRKGEAKIGINTVAAMELYGLR